MEVTVVLKGWEAAATYPRARKFDEPGKTRLKWFGRVGKGGMIEDSLDGKYAQGVFYEILWVLCKGGSADGSPLPSPKPANPGPEEPLVPGMLAL